MKKRWPLRLALLVVLVCLFTFGACVPGAQAADGVHANPIDDILDAVKASLVKLLQDLAKGVGIVLWAVLKLCGAVGLLGADFSTLFTDVIAEALNAVISGDMRTIIRGSLMLSIGLYALSLLARPFWPDLKVVNFQRAIIWGMAIQAYLLHAPAIYTELETWRVDLAEQVAGAVSRGSVPGCGGDTVETILCITGATPGEALDPSIKTFPATIPPYGYGETISQLYNHCVFNPPTYYGDPACSPDDPQGDPWDVMGSVQDAVGIQFVSLILGFLALAYGVLQLALGLAAGMMFILFPVAAMFAFFLPLESFPAGVIRNYISIFLKSVVLLTLAAVVVRLFSVAAGGPTGSSLLSLAAVGVVSLLICGIMAKEALASLLSSISFVGNSVSSIGAGIGLGGSGGGGAAGYASPESRMSAMMIGGGPVAQALMGAPNPYLMGMSGRGGVLGIPGAVAGRAGSGIGAAAAGGSARQAMMGALGAGGAIGLAAGAAAMGVQAVASGARRVLAPPRAPTTITMDAPAAGASGTPSSGATAGNMLVPTLRRTGLAPAAAAPTHAATGTSSAAAAVQAGLKGQAPDLGGWSTGSAARIQSATTRLGAMPPDVQDAALDLAATSHDVAGAWTAAGRSPVQGDGTLDPQFVEETVQRDPATATAFTLGQYGLPAEARVSLPEAVALGAATQRAIPAGDVGRGLARAVKNAGSGGFEAALQGQLGAGSAALFGDRAGQARQAAAGMQRAGLSNDLGRQLVETVHGDLRRYPSLTAADFRDRRPGRMAAWDRATGDAEVTDRIVEELAALGAPGPVSVAEIPRAMMQTATTPASPPPAPAPAPAPKPTPAPASEPGSQASSAPPNPALAARLNDWRRETAEKAGRPAFHVLTNATLQNIAVARPQTLEELQAVKGIGPKKAAQYGDQILAITHPSQPKEDGA